MLYMSSLRNAPDVRAWSRRRTNITATAAATPAPAPNPAKTAATIVPADAAVDPIGIARERLLFARCEISAVNHRPAGDKETRGKL